MMTTVKLQYFKASGKYYTGGSFTTEHRWPNLHLILEELHERRAEGMWDGLFKPCPEFHTLVLVPYLDGDTETTHHLHLLPATAVANGGSSTRFLAPQ